MPSSSSSSSLSTIIRWWHYRYLITFLLLVSPISAKAETILEEPCLAVVKDIYDEYDVKELSCQTPSGMLYKIPSVDSDWIEDKMLSGELQSGETLLNITNPLIDPETATLLLTDPPELINEEMRRRLGAKTGQRTVLAVRVLASNSAMSRSESELSWSVFGGPSDFVNLVSQYAACSHGKLQFQQRPNLNGRTTNIRNGVVSIQLSVPTSVGHEAMVNAVSRQIQTEFGKTRQDIADHIMYCLPPGAFGGVGYAYVNEGLSVFNNEWCTSVTSQMHELG